MGSAKRWLIGAVAATALGCLAVPGALATTPRAPAASWHLAYRAPNHYEIQGITAPARDDAWAYGSIYGKRELLGSFYLHWGGRAWRTAHVPAPRNFVATKIDASSPTNVWIFGYRAGYPYPGVALVYNGYRWTTIIGDPWAGDLPQELVADYFNVWAIPQDGCNTAADCTTTVEHWNGAGWQPQVVPGQMSLVAGGSRPWLVGTYVSGSARYLAVYRWNGTSWQQLTAPAARAEDAAGAASPGGRLWLVVQSRRAGPWRLYERRGSTWSSLGVLRRFPASDLGEPGLVYDGRNGFWALPFHWTGSRWVNAAPGLLLHPPRPRWLNELWFNYVATVPGSSAIWALVIANRLPYTTGTYGSAIAWYGSKP
jgi:hypothetical protein